MTKSVCIVGAGPSGLVAAKTLLHNAPKGEFKVSIFDSQDGIGGLWPTSKTDSGRQIHPLMVVNQSKHTVQFSDQAWDEGVPELPKAWLVGKYLEKYLDRYLKPSPDFELRLGTRVDKAERLQDGQAGWKVSLKSASKEETRNFDYLLVASGYFGKPIIPEVFKAANTTVPIIHSSQYRDLKGLLGKGKSGGGKILIVGGQMSGVEITGTIATHLSSEVNSPDQSEIQDIAKFTIHHAIQRPIWVFPLFTTPERSAPAAPFLPLDFASYNINNRPGTLTNTQGHIPEGTATIFHNIYQGCLGDQSEFNSLLQPTDKEKLEPPYLAVSDWYSDFVRSDTIQLALGKVTGLENNVATLSEGGSQIDDIAAVVLATGFDPSPCVDFLPQESLEAMQHSPQHPNQALALAFHGTHHPDVPNLGFVGFYRSPYWGVMQMQARFLTDFWSDQKGPEHEPIRRKLETDDSIQRILGLRDDPRISQFPMGDYMYLTHELSEALEMKIQPPLIPDSAKLSHNSLPLDMLTPSRYISPSDDPEAQSDAQKSLQQTRDLTVEALTTPKFVARGAFRSLAGTWRLERDVESRHPSLPSGTFVGTAKFLLRERTMDGLQCAKDGTPAAFDDDFDLEYLYIEEGEFKTESGFGFSATRRYVWRYNEAKDKISVWFVKPDDPKRADYLFHEVDFEPLQDGNRDKGWVAKSGHLCVEDYYNVKYNFAFSEVNLKRWVIEYTVEGPQKDYTIHGTYTRV